MALSIKTREADNLARHLARLTGETMTNAVTIALRERLDREQARLATRSELPRQLAKLAATLRAHYDTRPITREEWDEASGEAG